MKLIEQSCEIWNQGYTISEIFDHIARCTRVCYQSIPKENEPSINFLQRTIFKHKEPEKDHLAMAEHGTVYMNVPVEEYEFYKSNPYSRINNIPNSELFAVTTNMRVILENYRNHDFMYIVDPTKYHDERITVSFITSIAISRELNRHRVHSICEESTRYCNYSINKFNNELTFIHPYKLNAGIIQCYDNAEKQYNALIEEGYIPEEARCILPLGLKTHVVHTAFKDDWKQFINLRVHGISGKPHPEMVELCKPLIQCL